MAYLEKPIFRKDLPIESNLGLKTYFLNKEAIETILLSDLINHLKFMYSNGIKKGNSFYIGNIQGDKGDSLVITLSGRYAGKGKDFATGESIDIFDMFANHYNLNIQHEFKALLQRLSEYLGFSQSEAKPLSQAEIISIRERQEQSRLQAIEAEKTALLETIKKQETALKLWNDAICINHPTAQEYLKARGLDIQFNMHVMRYLPEAWHSELKINLPCIIALVRTTKGTPYIQSNGQPLINIQTGKPILEYAPSGIERHYLAPFLIDGEDFMKMDWLQDDDPEKHLKAHKEWFRVKGLTRRMMLGSKKQGVVMLNGCNPCHERLILTEGVIDAYSIMFNITDKNCTVKNASNPLGGIYWAFLGVNNLKDIIIPEHIKEIIYFVDNDKAGNQSIEFLEQNNTVKGRNNNDLKITIKRIKRNDTKDFNDLITKKKPVTAVTERA